MSNHPFFEAIKAAGLARSYPGVVAVVLVGLMILGAVIFFAPIPNYAKYISAGILLFLGVKIWRTFSSRMSSMPPTVGPEYPGQLLKHGIILTANGQLRSLDDIRGLEPEKNPMQLPPPSKKSTKKRINTK